MGKGIEEGEMGISRNGLGHGRWDCCGHSSGLLEPLGPRLFEGGLEVGLKAGEVLLVLWVFEHVIGHEAWQLFEA